MFKNKEEQFDFYWKEIFTGLAYNPIEFNTYRFDQTMSLPGKVNKLYELFKQLAMNNQEVMDYLKEFVETFDEKLYQTIDDILTKWLEDGILTEVIRNTINEEVVEARTDYLGKKYGNLKERLDSEKADVVEVSAQLTQKAHQYYIDMVEDFGAHTDGVTNNNEVLQTVFSTVEDNTEIFFPKGDYFITNTDTFMHPLNPSDPGLGGDTTFASLIGKKNIKILGEKGTRFIVRQDITIYSLWVFSFYGCENIEISGIEIDYEATGNPNAMTHPLTNLNTGRYAQTRAGLMKFQVDNEGNPCKTIHIHHNNFRIHHVEGAYPGLPYSVGNVPYSGSGKLIGLLLYGNYASSEKTSVWVEDITIEHNTFTETQARVIWLWVTKKAKIMHNKFLKGSGGLRPCVRVLHGCHELEVSGNYFEIANNWKTGANHEGAIVVADNGGVHYRRNVIIKDNHIFTQHGPGIDIAGVDVAFVVNNHIEVDPNYNEDIMDGEATYTGIRLRGTGSDPDYKKTKNVLVDGNIVEGKQYGIHARIYENVKIINNTLSGGRVGMFVLNYATETAMVVDNNLILNNVNGVEHNLNTEQGAPIMYRNNDIVLNEYGFYGFVGAPGNLSYILFNRFNGNKIASLHRFTNSHMKSVGNIWNDTKQVENDTVVNEVELY